MKKKIRKVKDGRIIVPRETASAGKDKKEQLWEVEDLDRAFDLWESNKDLPPKERWSKNKIAKETGIPYTNICERLWGRHGGGKRGKIAGGKWIANMLKTGKFKWVIFWKVDWNQVGNRSSPHNDIPFNFYLFKIEQEWSLKDIVMLYARRGFQFSQTQLCMPAYEMATREGQKGLSPVKQKAGRCWLKGFYQWFSELPKKMAVNFSIAHAMAANPTQRSKFFDQYEEWLNQWGLEYSPNCSRNSPGKFKNSYRSYHYAHA